VVKELGERVTVLLSLSLVASLLLITFLSHEVTVLKEYTEKLESRMSELEMERQKLEMERQKLEVRLEEVKKELNRVRNENSILNDRIEALTSNNAVCQPSTTLREIEEEREEKRESTRGNSSPEVSLHFRGDPRVLVTPNDSLVMKIAEEIMRKYPEGDETSLWLRASEAFKYAKSLRYERDSEDNWSTPRETISRGGGDCEDLSILLASLLRALGYTPESVRVVVGYTSMGSHSWVEILVSHNGSLRWLPLDPVFGKSFDEYLYSDYPVLRVLMRFNDVYYEKLHPS